MAAVRQQVSLMRLTKAARQRLRQLELKLHQAKLSPRRGGFSHSREEQILKHYIAELLPPDHPKTAVDIGAGDGIRWSNTYALFSEGWKGLGIEFDERNFARLARAYKYYPSVFACRALVTPQNILPLLQSYAIEREFAVLSLDIDGNDYWVLSAILSEFRPRLIVTEINEKIPPPIRFVVKYNPNFQLSHHFFGYSFSTLTDLCEQYEYCTLELEYNNAFLAPKELVGSRSWDARSAYHRGYLDRPDRQERFRQNLDLEIVHSLSPEQAMEFLREFYSDHEGEYYLTLSNESPAKASGKPHSLLQGSRTGG